MATPSCQTCVTCSPIARRRGRRASMTGARSGTERTAGSHDQRSGGSLPSLKPGEILGAGAVFGRGVWLGFPCPDGPSSCLGTFLVLEPVVFVEPMLLAIVVSPGPRRPETYHSFVGFAAWARGAC